MQALRHYLLAVQFFTRIPITGRLADWVGFSPDMLRASAAHLPGIGWLAGAPGHGGVWLTFVGLGGNAPAAAVAAVFCTVATVLLTGGSMRTAWPTWPTAWAAATTASVPWTS